MNEINQQGKSTPKPTPFHSRSYMGSLSFSHTPASNSHPRHVVEQDCPSEFEGVIYGTNVSVARTIREIQRFIITFEATFQKEEQFITQKVYLAKLRDLQNVKDATTADITFQIDAQHLCKYNQNLYLQLIYFPVQMISCFDMVLHNLFEREFIEPDTNFQSRNAKIKRKEDIRMGIVNLANKDKVCVKQLSTNHLGRLVSIKGLVIRVSEIFPEMKSAYFKCINCRKETIVLLQNARIQQPSICKHCNQSQCLQLIHNLCQFTNKQYIKFQELLKNISEGHSPSSTTIIAYDCNADRIKPGDTIEMIGIYRCHPVPLQRGKTIYRQVFNTYFDLISFQRLEQKGNRIKQNKSHFSDEELRQFFKIANRSTVIDDLINSFAPSIFGCKQIKKGILAQLFGGSKKDSVLKDRRFRSQVNICLIGDPSTAKSQFLQQVHKIAPRSIYTCGRGSSAVGLTASIKKDPQTKEFVLESGALVLSDQGICCIDEFDKMEPNTRTVLLEVMQQQTISIAKAGIVCQLNSRTAILAAANPIESKYNIKKSIIQNINLPPTLISRFDLIYLLLDTAKEEQDRKLAAHILDLYAADAKKQKKKIGVYSMQLLANYITYARETVSIVGQEAAQKLKAEYIKLRQVGSSNKTITATPRQLQSMIRLSQAFAKMRLSAEVTAQDVQQAINLMNFATLKSVTDPQTGLIDMDSLMTGRTATAKKRTTQLAKNIKQIMKSNENVYSCFTTIGRFQEEYWKKHPKDEVTKQELHEALKILESEDYIYLLKNKEGLKFKLKMFNQQ